MMNGLVRLVLVLSVVVHGKSVSQAQEGLLGNVDSDATEYLLDFVASRDELTANYAAIGRGKAFSLRAKNDKISASDLWFIDASLRVDSDTHRLSAFAIKQDTSGLSRSPIWCQTLTSGGKRYLRQGNPIKGRGIAADEDEVVTQDEEGSVTRRLLPRFDPFFLSFAEGSSLLLSLISNTYGENALGMMSFIEAKRNADGDVEGIWKVSDKNGYYLDITFDGDQGNRPTRVVWLIKDGPILKAEDGMPKDLRVTDSINNRWAHVDVANNREGGDNAKVWLPVEISRSDFSPDGVSYTDTKYRIHWKRLTSEFEFPEPEDTDWRYPVAELFEIDWSVAFTDFPIPVSEQIK